MQISRTEQLFKALALDFIHNKKFNISILQLLCQDQKMHSSTTHEEMSSKINVIDKGFQLLKQHEDPKREKDKHRINYKPESSFLKSLYHMASIFIFNVSATNEHYMNQIQKQMAESTATQSAAIELNKTFYKDKMAINILREHLKSYFDIFTNKSKFLKNIIDQIITHPNLKITESELGLLQTVDYLCVKYSIHNQTSDKIVKILEKNQNSIEENASQLVRTDIIKQINKLLFSESGQEELFHVLESNPHVDFKNLLGIINANYLSTTPPRKIFSTASLSGKEAIQSITVKIIKRISKNQLFSQKTEDYTPFRLLLFHFFSKHFSVYMQFNSLIRSLINDLPWNAESKTNDLKKIEKFFRVFISVENPLFQQSLQFIFNVLSRKYSESVGIELMKKLLLNRFLLNPSFYVMYNDPDEDQLKGYVQAANFVRTLFYPNKVEELASRTKSPQLIKISSQILYSLNYCLKKQKDNKFMFQSSSFLYINDKIIKSQILQLHEELKQSNRSPKQASKVQNFVSDYSLSFELIKHEHTPKNNPSRPVIENVSEVKLSANTNRTNTKVNQSIRFMYEQLRGKESHPQIPIQHLEKNLKINTRIEYQEEKIPSNNRNGVDRVSQMARKQHEITNQTRLNSVNLPTDRQIIEELVELRKEYGELKKALKRQKEQRRLDNRKRMGSLVSFSARFNQFKDRVQSQNNSLYVHMTTIA